MGRYLKKVPIPRVDKRSKAKVGLHDQLVQLVNQRTETEQAVRRRGAPAAHDVAVRRAAALDAAIDDLVAKLFGLTTADVAVLFK